MASNPAKLVFWVWALVVGSNGVAAQACSDFVSNEDGASYWCVETPLPTPELDSDLIWCPVLLQVRGFEMRRMRGHARVRLLPVDAHVRRRHSSRSQRRDPVPELDL